MNWSKRNWSNVFRIILIIDSAIFLCKLALAVWMIVYGIGEQIQFDQREKSDNSYLTQMVLVLLFLGSGTLLIFIVLRWITNVIQYRHEARNLVSENIKGCGCKGCGCCNKICCWFVVCVPHIVINGILIRVDWTKNEWLQKVVIPFLCWELLVISFVVVYISLLHFKAETAGFLITVDLKNPRDEEEM